MSSPRHRSVPSSIRLLLLICLVAGAARVYVPTQKPLNYDEYWHVFIAQQDTREGLAREWRNNAHPPLYYWLLRIPISLARGPLLDRSISLLAGILAVLVMGQILTKIAKDPAIAPLGAFAFALAPSALLISSEVRSYMLCTFFLLLAFSQYVSLVKERPSFRTLVVFSGASCLALLSHYFAIFFLAAGLAVGVYVAATRLLAGEGIAALATWAAAGLAAAFPILGAASFLYRTHLRGMPLTEQHLSAFYYHPHSGESLFHYVIDASWNAFNLFAPVPVAKSRAVVVFALCLAVLVGALIYLSRIRSRARTVVHDLPLLFLVFLIVALLAASVRGAYPFGGDLRQQFILFPFLLLTILLLLDSMLSWRARLRRPLIAIVLLAVCLNSGLRMASISAREESGGFEDMFAREMSLHETTFPEAPAVYLGQFSLIVYFAHHDRWRWRAVDANTYEIMQGGRTVVVMRDERNRWNLDVLDATLYKDLSRRLESLRLKSTTVFSLRYPFPPEPWTSSERDELRREVPVLAARAHLDTVRLILDGFNAFAQFRLHEAAAVSSR